MPAKTRREAIRRLEGSTGLKYNSPVYHVDQIMPFARRGSNTLDTLRLVEMRKNLRKVKRFPSWKSFRTEESTALQEASPVNQRSFRTHAALAMIAVVWPLSRCGSATTAIAVSPPPFEARMPTEAIEPLGSFVEMGAPAAKRHIVSGVEQDQQTNQWRLQSCATLRFLTLPLDELRFGLNFDLPPESIPRANPLTLRITLNGQPFIEKTFDSAGLYSIDEAVPKGLVSWERETRVEIMIESPAGRPIERPLLQIISVGFRP